MNKIVFIIPIICFCVGIINEPKPSNKKIATIQMFEHVYKLKYIKAEEAIKAIKIKDVVITNSNSRLIIYANSKNIEKVLNILSKIDIPEKQIFLKINVISIDKTLMEKVGAILTKKNDNGLSTLLSQGFIPLIKFFELNAFSFDIDLLKTNGNLQVTTATSILTVENNEAIFFLTEDLNIQVDKNKYEKDSAGVMLKIKPRIIEKNGVEKIEAIISYENSKFSNDKKIKNKIETKVNLIDKRYKFIGGIKQNSEVNKKTSTPFLSDIPLIGNLFTKNEKIHQNKEIYIELFGEILDE